MRTRILVAALAAGLLAGAGCTRRDQSAVIQIKGSDTMVNLGAAWAEEYMKKNPEVKIAVTGGGSGTGIAAVINGTAHAAQASRAMKDAEKKQAEEQGRPAGEHKVAVDALVVAVHPQNPVDTLTIDQLSQVFQGKVTNWKELGGPDAKIHVISRERNSGTHVYFLEEVVRKGNEKGPEEFAPEVIMAPSSQRIYEEVSENPNAIGYYGLGYLGDKNKPLKVKKGEGAAVAPSVDSAIDRSYPIARPLFIYTAGEPTPALKAYLDFVMGDDGQRVVLAQGFVPLRKVTTP